MNYSVPCDTVKRLLNIDTSVRLEGNLAIALSRQFLVIEKLPWVNPDDAIQFRPQTDLRVAIKKEALFADSFVQITAFPMVHLATAVTGQGFACNENCAIWDNPPENIERWRTLLPDEPPVAPNGGMFWSTAEMVMLASSSPSGRLVFPEIIDVDKPIIVRDDNDPNWCALFLGKCNEAEIKPAKLPAWLKGTM